MTENPDPGVTTTLDALVRLKHKAQGFTFLPRQPMHSLLAGKHASRLRGRGLNFEEIRNYFPGDDIRAMDWKATQRTGKPHVRVYTEERDRPAFVVVDQRAGMFFGSQRSMKSVTAAELAADNIRVTNVYPGETNTPILDKRPVPLSAEHRASILQPADVAAAVLMVACLPPRAHIPELVITPTWQPFV